MVGRGLGLGFWFGLRIYIYGFFRGSMSNVFWVKEMMEGSSLMVWMFVFFFSRLKDSRE